MGTVRPVWFVGAPVSLDRGQGLPANAGADIVATRVGDRHLTLAFLGRVDPTDALRLWHALPPLALPDQARALAWARFGRRAIALEIVDDGVLHEAAATCVDRAAEHVPSYQRPSSFRPHVTLGRVPKRSHPPTRAALRAWPLPDGPLRLGSLTLYRSATDAGGDRYERVAHQE